MSPVRRACLSLTSAIVFCQSAFAIIQPSFELVPSAWKATHIVVVTEGDEIDGICRVVASWKGDLPPGAVIIIPGLAAFAPEEKRRVHLPQLADKDTVFEPHVSCRRMVVFLRRVQAARGMTEGGRRAAPPRKRMRWLPADHVGIHVSVAWIERGTVYEFFQEMNPGPSLLHPTRRTEADLRAEVGSILELQRELRRARGAPDVAARVRALVPYAVGSYGSFPFLHACSKEDFASVAAIAELARCGEPGLRALRALEKDEGAPHGEVLMALARSGGGAEIVPIIERETAYWRRTAPTLGFSWYERTFTGGTPPGSPRDHYDRMYGLFEILVASRLAGCKEALRGFHEEWNAHHPLRAIPIVSLGDRARSLAEGTRRPMAGIATCGVRLQVLTSSTGAPRVAIIRRSDLRSRWPKMRADSDTSTTVFIDEDEVAVEGGPVLFTRTADGALVRLTVPRETLTYFLGREYVRPRGPELIDFWVAVVEPQLMARGTNPAAPAGGRPVE